jgi:hypothetical protein
VDESLLVRILTKYVNMTISDGGKLDHNVLARMEISLEQAKLWNKDHSLYYAERNFLGFIPWNTLERDSTYYAIVYAVLTQ